MYTSKLGQLLLTFNTSDWKRFLTFVESPYFNTNTDVIRLGQSVYQLRGSESITKAEVYRHCFPGQPFDTQRMGTLMNYLLKLAEHFLSVEKFLKDDFESVKDQLWELSDRKLSKHYDFLLRKLEKQLGKDDNKISAVHLSRQFRLAEVKMFHFSNQKVRRGDPIMQEVYQKLNLYYYTRVLQYSCALISWQLVVNGKFELSKVTTNLIEDLYKDPPKYPLILIYLSIYKAIVTGEEENGLHFQNLLAYLEKYEQRIEHDEIKEIYLYAINFCARKIRKGENSYSTIVLNLYDEGIRHKYLHTNGYLSHWTYTNVVKMGLLQHRYDWVEEFINRYKEELQPEFYEDAFHFNLAELYFTKGLYNEVLDHIQHLSFSDPYYNLGTRMIMIKTFYELNEEESLLARLASFTIYLKRDTNLSSTYQQTCLNFCKLLHQILKVNSDQKKEKLIREIEQTKPLAERNWLLTTLRAQKINPVSRY